MESPPPFTEQITFLSVEDLSVSSAFFGDTLALALVVDQGDCRIYRVTDDAYLGVCSRPGRTETEGVIVTLVTDDVDGWHNKLVSAGVECVRSPANHPKYDIYQAFYHDPDGHLIEIQRFADPQWMEPV